MYSNMNSYPSSKQRMADLCFIRCPLLQVSSSSPKRFSTFAGESKLLCLQPQRPSLSSSTLASELLLLLQKLSFESLSLGIGPGLDQMNETKQKLGSILFRLFAEERLKFGQNGTVFGDCLIQDIVELIFGRFDFVVDNSCLELLLPSQLLECGFVQKRGVEASSCFMNDILVLKGFGYEFLNAFSVVRFE